MTHHKKLKMPNGLLPATHIGKPETLLRVRHKMNESQKVIYKLRYIPKQMVCIY